MSTTTDTAADQEVISTQCDLVIITTAQADRLERYEREISMWLDYGEQP